MSKPTAMCFPLLVLCVDWQKCRLSSTADVRGLFSRTWPLFAIAIATGILAAYSQTHAEGYDVRALFNAPFLWRILNAAVAVGLYVFQLILPAGIHLDYRAVPGQFPLHGVLGLAVLAAMLAAGAWALWRMRGKPSLRHGGAAAVWFFAALLPTLGIFGSFGEHARADRFMYVPSMALVLAVMAVPAFTTPWRRRLALAIAGCAVLAVAAMAVPVAMSYRSDTAAFTRTLRFDPGNGRALAHVGQAECAQPGGMDKGIAHLRQSQAVRPRDDTAAQLAYALAMRGHADDFAEIRRLCGKFACDHRLDVKGQALEALGMTALRQRRWQEAISCLEDSIRAPRRFYSADDARLRLAAACCNSGQRDKALQILDELSRSNRIDIQGKARQFMDILSRNPHAVLMLN